MLEDKGRAEVVQAAEPELNVTASHPLIVIPLLVKATSPVGLLPPETVAVNVTELPTLLGFELDDNPIVDVARFTICDTALDVTVSLFVSPLYTAVIEAVPKVSSEVEHVAEPAVNVTASHPVMDVVPDLKFTVPVGLSPPLIVAVNVTELPITLGFGLDANPIAGVA